jgi:hypothetical protein
MLHVHKVISRKTDMSFGLRKKTNFGAKNKTFYGIYFVFLHRLARVNSANVLDEGLRIGGRGRRINLKVKISQTRRDYACIENKRDTQLAQSQSIPGRPLLALYIGGQVSRNRSGLIQITVFVYDTISYFDYVYDCPNLTGLRGTKTTDFISYTLISSPRDFTRIVDSG